MTSLLIAVQRSVPTYSDVIKGTKIFSPNRTIYFSRKSATCFGYNTTIYRL